MVLTQLYRAIANVADADYVVDSSKAPAYAIILSRMRNVDIRLLHMVRDVRGVAYSATKKKIRTDVAILLSTCASSRSCG